MMIACVPGVLLGFEVAQWVNTNLGDPLDASLCTLVAVISIITTSFLVCFLVCFLVEVVKDYAAALLKRIK